MAVGTGRQGVVYIAGPMTGREHYNHAAFMAEKERWEEHGWKVITPIECNNIVWRRWHGRDFDPTVDRCDWGDPLLAHMFVEDLRALLVEADAIALLPDWDESTGATAELLLAWMFDKRILGGMGGWPRKLAYELGRALMAAISRLLARREG